MYFHWHLTGTSGSSDESTRRQITEEHRHSHSNENHKCHRKINVRTDEMKVRNWLGPARLGSSHCFFSGQRNEPWNTTNAGNSFTS